jgi:hypothetical protein
MYIYLQDLQLKNDRLQQQSNQVFVQCVQDIEDQSIKSHHHLHKIIINTLLHQQDYKGELSTIIMKILKTIYTLYY